VNLAALEARMRAVSEQFDKSVERKAKGPKFIDFKKPGKYVVRVLPSCNYPIDVRWFRKSGAKYLINVVTPDRQDIVQTAEVPQTFIKFLRVFQDMVNQLFCDPQHGNLIAFEAFPNANGFGNDYKIIKQQPMPTNFTAEQIPDLDELKAAIDDIKPVWVSSGSLAAPLAGVTPAINTSGFSDPFAAFAASPAINTTPVAPVAGPAIDGSAINASGVNAQFAAAHAAAAPAAPPAPAAASPVSGISDTDAARLKAQLLAMVGQGSAKAKARALRPVRP
jgi:hypothetical protein